MRRNINIGRVISHMIYTVLVLWVGGVVLGRIGETMLGECSPFFEGFELIGWEIGTNVTAYDATCPDAGNPSACTATLPQNSSLHGVIDPTCEQINADTILYDTGDSGVLAVVGLIGLASVVMEFVEFKL